MASLTFRQVPISAFFRPISRFNISRTLASTPTRSSIPLSTPETPTTTPTSPSPSSSHFKITLTRSGISLSKKVQRTLLALGFHRRFQTVYFPYSPEVAGKILRVKELVHVENVSENMVMSKQQQRLARKATRGYRVVGSRKGSFMGV